MSTQATPYARRCAAGNSYCTILSTIWKAFSQFSRRPYLVLLRSTGDTPLRGPPQRS